MKGKIFNAQEVQAIIAGNKTMFREVIKKTEDEIENYSLPDRCGTGLLLSECPYQVGQKIFVKESFFEHDNKILFKASHQKLTTHFLGSIKWRPAQRMKQEHSRLTLEITDIKVERLGEISEEDAFKEGVFKSKDYWHSTLHPIKGTYQCWTSEKEAFSKLWNAIHKKPEEKFEANPFVWVVDFKINK